jgi:CspA family cold shock protein
MPEGKVIRFDEIRGYGFVAPSSGGEDVFLHVNDLEFDKRLLGPGVFVKFDVEDGDRGLKASRVGLVDREHRAAAPAPKPSLVKEVVDDGMCDVLTVKEFLEEVTESLLGTAPAITGEQIILIRQRLAQLARNHGWVES